MTTMTTVERRPVEDLSYANLTAQSVNIDWSETWRRSDAQAWYAVETFDYEHTSELGTKVDLVLGTSNGSVTGVWLGTKLADPTWLSFYDVTYDESLCIFCGMPIEQDDTESGGDACPAEPEGRFHQALSRADINELEAIEPSQWGAEGPMMNYYYPLGDGPSGYSRACIGLDNMTEEAAAFALRDLSMCLVYLEDRDEYVLALTGGGMDMTWTIVGAYVALGYLPPVGFCRHPGFRQSSDTPYLIAAMRQSLIGMTERLQRELEILDEQVARYES